MLRLRLRVNPGKVFATTANEGGWTGEEQELVLRAWRDQIMTLEAVTTMQDELIAALKGTSGEFSSWGLLEHAVEGGLPEGG